MSDFIPYGKQNISKNDIESVIEVLKSDFLTQGTKVPEFEQKITNYVCAKGAVAVNSATSALHIACLALGVSEGDYVWTSPITFVATSNCALYCGAKVDFVDIEPETFNMCPNELRLKLQKAKKVNKLPKVVIPVHMAGQSCDMEEIYKLSKEYGFKIIEDASHAIGGKYQGGKIGSCEYSDITVFSFHPVKIITTAEGGVATSNNLDLLQKMELFRSHGITRDKSLLFQDHGPWYYEQQCLGLNYRMTEIQAALGISQMDRLDEFIAKRHELANNYFKAFEASNIKLPLQKKENYSSFHLFILRFPTERYNRLEVFNHLRENNIGVNVHYIPVYLQPYYKDLGFEAGLCPKAEKYYNEVISIPLFGHLTIEEQNIIIEKILKIRS